VRVALGQENGRIGWLLWQADGRVLLQPAPMSARSRSQGVTPERWRHYALQMLEREAHLLHHRDPAGIAAYVAADPDLHLEHDHESLPPDLPAPQVYGQEDQQAAPGLAGPPPGH
jgi:hypothetical protein